MTDITEHPSSTEIESISDVLRAWRAKARRTRSAQPVRPTRRSGIGSTLLRPIEDSISSNIGP